MSVLQVAHNTNISLYSTAHIFSSFFVSRVETTTVTAGTKKSSATNLRKQENFRFPFPKQHAASSGTTNEHGLKSKALLKLSSFAIIASKGLVACWLKDTLHYDDACTA